MLVEKEAFMLLSLAVLFAIEILSSGAGPPPDVKDFTPVLSKELEFRIDDCRTGFVGRVVEYQNPNNPSESVRVYYRQKALVSKRACENKTAETVGLDTNLSNLNYHFKQETDALGRVQKATDAFAYVQWRTVRDLRTGQDIRTGLMQIWLLDSNGTFAYSSRPENVEESALKSQPLSEPSKADLRKRIGVGIKFTLADAVHIVRIDQDDILASVKEADDEKK